MPKQSFSDIACSIARASDVIGERWTLLILRDLFAGITRFEDFRRDLGIASNVLTDRLDTLCRNHIVERREYQTSPPRHEYLLTERGRELYPVIANLIAWGDKWLADESGPPALIVHTTCGHTTTAHTVCGACGEPLSAETAQNTAGPGGRTASGTALIGQFLHP